MSSAVFMDIPQIDKNILHKAYTHIQSGHFCIQQSLMDVHVLFVIPFNTPFDFKFLIWPSLSQRPRKNSYCNRDKAASKALI